MCLKNPKTFITKMNEIKYLTNPYINKTYFGEIQKIQKTLYPK